MKTIYIIVLAVILPALILAGCRPQNPLEGASLSEFTGHLDNRIVSLMDRYAIPGVSIAIVKGGKTVWINAYGYADKEAGRKMVQEDYCRVESISKSVTAWGVLNLVEEGKLELDRPITDYLKSWELPESEFSEDKITVRQLLSQNSGMPLGTIGVRYAPTEAIPTLKEQLSGDAVLFQEPGTSFSYSNAGFNLLELLVEEVTGQEFASYMKKEVLLPLGMQHSSFAWKESFGWKVPNGYSLQGDPIPVYVYPDKAAGGLFATVDDVASFVCAGMKGNDTLGGRVLDPYTIESLYVPRVNLSGYYKLVFDAYGFGHFIEYLPDGMLSVSHGGQGSGWMTHFQSVPEAGDGIVILTNSQRSWPFFGYILEDWARWNGFGSVGMGRIVWASKALIVAIGVVFAFLLWQWIRLGRQVLQGNRKVNDCSRQSLFKGLRYTILALLIFWALGWMVTLDYFFLFSVFPIGSKYLLYLFFMSAVTLLLLALFPVRTEVHTGSKGRWIGQQ